MRTLTKLKIVLFIIILILACIPAFLDIGLHEVFCEYSSNIDEREADGTEHFNGWYQITFQFYHLINETNLLFRAWSSGEITYIQDEEPPFSQYSIDFHNIQKWVSYYDRIHDSIKCFVNLDNTKVFKVVGSYDRFYYQNFLLIILPLYAPLMFLILMGLLINITVDDPR